MPGHLSAAEAPEDLWTCHECGWTYPNHHPSAKHRRNHKKVCGSIPGFIGTISSRKAAPEPAPSVTDGASSDDASSDDEITPDESHEKRGLHHTSLKVAPSNQAAAASGGTRAAKSLCVTHRSKDPCLHSEDANMKPAPLTDRTLLDQNNRQALQSTGSTPNAPVKPQHVRRRSAHALEGVWVCRHCGWTYPNAHPSAKHRRKHKKKCPALVVTPRHVVGAGGSSDDASSDEENKRGDAAPEKQEVHATNISSTTASLPTGLEAFLGRSDSKRELRDLQDTIILLSPKPVSRRNSFKNPTHRRDSPSGFLSPRGGMKNSKAVNNSQAHELVAGIEKKPEAVSDQENEDPVVLNLPTARILTPRSVPAPDTVVGEMLPEGRRSSSDESDLNNSDGETPSSPDSVLQPVQLLLPISTSTTSEETGTSDQEGTGEEITENPLNQEAAVAAADLQLDLEIEKVQFANETAVKYDHHGTAPELRPFTCEASPEVVTSESEPAAAEDQKDSHEVSSTNGCQPFDASPCIQPQTAETGAICGAKDTEVTAVADVKLNLSAWKYVASSLVVKPAVETAAKAHVEPSTLALDSDIAPEHVTIEALVVGRSSDEHDHVQDPNKSQILSENESVSIPSIPAVEKLIEGQSWKDLDWSEMVTTETVVGDGTITLDDDISSGEARREISTAIKSQEDDWKAGDTELECGNPLNKSNLQETSDKDGSALAEEDPEILRAPAEASEGVNTMKGDAETFTSAVLSSGKLPEKVHVDPVKEEDRDSKASSSDAVSRDQPVKLTVDAVKEKEDRDFPLFSSKVPSVDQSLTECTGEAMKGNTNFHSLSSTSLSLDESPVEVTVKQEDKCSPLITSEVSSSDQSPVDCTGDVEPKILPILSSGSAAEQLPVDKFCEVPSDKQGDLPASSTEGLAPGEYLFESNTHSTTLLSVVQENTNIFLDSLNAPEVQPTSTDNTLEISSQPTSIVTPLCIASTQTLLSSPDAEPEDDLSSELPANKEPLNTEPTLDETPCTVVGTSDLNAQTPPTSKSQVVVTGSVGIEEKEAKKPDQSESQTTDVVEEKTTSSVASDSHFLVAREKLPEASHHSGAAEEEWKVVRGSEVAEESKEKVSHDADHSHNKGEIDSEGACDATAEEQISSNPEATSTLDSPCSIVENQVAVDKLKVDLPTFRLMEQKEVSPGLAEVWEVNIKDQVLELNEKVTTDERIEVADVLELSTIDSDDVVAEVTDRKAEDLEKEVKVVTESKGSQGTVEEKIPPKDIGESSSKSSVDDGSAHRCSSSKSCDTSMRTTEGAGAAVRGQEEKQEDVAPRLKQARTVTTRQDSELAEKENAPAKQVGLFGQYKEKFNKLQREPSQQARDPRPTITRLPGSGKRKLLPSLYCTFDDSPVLKNKKQESRPGKDRGRDVQSETEVPFKLTFTRRLTARTSAESPPSSPQRTGGPGSPEGIVKERIETYERLIGKTRSFGPIPVPSPTYHKFSFSSGRPSSPHVSGPTIVTSQQVLENGHEAPSEEQIQTAAAHLHHVEPKGTTKVEDTHNAPEELLHEALSHLRHNNNNERDSSSTEPEDSSSKRISKVPQVLKEAAEQGLSPVPKLTKAC